MYFTTAQRERRVSCKEAFIPHLSERWCREKKERRIPVCDCVCVQDCVRVFREDGACFFGRDMFLQGPSLKETVKSRFVLLVLCPQKGEVQETCDCVPPPVCVAAIAPFSCGDIAPECRESSLVGEKRKMLCDCVTMFVLVQKNKQKKTAVSCRIEWNELTWLMRSSNAALPMWTPLNKNLRAFLTIFFFLKGGTPTLRAVVRNASGFGCQVIFVS